MALKEVQKELLKLLADGRFHSGSELSDQLGLSRTAIWGHTKALKKQGLELHSVAGKGYRLTQPLELLNAELIRLKLNKLATNSLSRLDIYDITDSTNGQLSNLARLGVESGAACLAETQTAGKGRLGRKWASPFGRNIYLSLLWNYESGPAALSGLSLAIGVSVMRALDQEGNLGLGLKWPNDIFWKGKKLGGVLVEVMGDALGPCTVVVGIGLNVDLPDSAADEIDQPWSDLKRVMSGNPISRNELVSKLLNELLPVLENFDKVGLADYYEEWSSKDCLAGTKAILKIGKEQLLGTAKGITEEGLLLFEDEMGHRKAYASGEVSLRASGHCT
jgi:BirA family biotin operon repressor/biotin-[acetyl-CoA-carboxylase] ligase